jgi:hypothetical protein
MLRAEACALTGQRSDAIDALVDVVDQGGREFIASHPALVTLCDDPEFDRRKKARAEAYEDEEAYEGESAE